MPRSTLRSPASIPQPTLIRPTTSSSIRARSRSLESAVTAATATLRSAAISPCTCCRTFTCSVMPSDIGGARRRLQDGSLLGVTRSGGISFGILADTVRKTKIDTVQIGTHSVPPTQGDSYDKSIVPFRHDLAQGNFDRRQQRRKRWRRL